jgi:hypothetical protein
MYKCSIGIVKNSKQPLEETHIELKHVESPLMYDEKKKYIYNTEN